MLKNMYVKAVGWGEKKKKKQEKKTHEIRGQKNNAPLYHALYIQDEYRYVDNKYRYILLKYLPAHAQKKTIVFYT